MPRLIDLSQPIYEGMKVYPGHLKTVTFHTPLTRRQLPGSPPTFPFRPLDSC